MPLHRCEDESRVPEEARAMMVTPRDVDALIERGEVVKEDIAQGGGFARARPAGEQHNLYGDVTLEVVKANPYLLVDREFEVEFSQADALALSLGVGTAPRTPPLPGEAGRPGSPPAVRRAPPGGWTSPPTAPGW